MSLLRIEKLLTVGKLFSGGLFTHHDSRIRSVPELPFQIERYIVKQLACEVEPETIAEDVQGQFLREVSTEYVQAYHPEAEEATLPADLRELYRQTRSEYTGTSPEEERDRTFVAVATTEVFEDRSLHCIEEAGTALVLVQHGGEFTALANRCTHQGGPLCEGKLDDGSIECPWHGARFHVKTGAPAEPPATEGVDTYAVRVRDDAIEVKL